MLRISNSESGIWNAPKSETEPWSDTYDNQEIPCHEIQFHAQNYLEYYIKLSLGCKYKKQMNFVFRVFSRQLKDVQILF